MFTRGTGALWSMLATLMVLCLACSGASPATPPPTQGGRGGDPLIAPASKERPNFVFVLTDDLDTGTNLSLFPNISRELVAQGTTLRNFFVSNSWCCPSRSTILRSQYVHSHGVVDNVAPNGGFFRFRQQGLENSTVGTWLRSSGYRTAMVGKYLNNYPHGADPTYRAPGWDNWQVPMKGLYQQYGYRINENGVPRAYGKTEGEYLTDVLSRKATEFIRQPKDRPFFLYLGPTPPHNPATPAKRHAKAFPNEKIPRGPSFNQKSLRTEPSWLRKVRPLSKKQIATQDALHRQRLRSMLSVDDMVAEVMRALRETRQLDNTYVVFTSDNGFHLGQHRLRQGKTTPFEEDIRVPAIVRGPKVTPGRQLDALTATVDWAPTFAELADAKTPGFAEGRSMAPLLTEKKPPAKWRTGVLMEFFNTRGAGPDESPSPRPPGYAALRTQRYTYVEYVTGERQLYDLQQDPFQLSNIATTADQALVSKLSTQLNALKSCRAAQCRTADGS